MRYDIEKMAVDVEELDRAISGEHDGLFRSFVWWVTPQGRTFWQTQWRDKTPLDIDALKDIKRQYMHHTGKAGKLKDMHVRAGDVVRNSVGGNEYTIKERLPGVLSVLIGLGGEFYFVDIADSAMDYTLISLADDAQPDAPKKWGDMTDAEKGALLLAAHDGKVIEYYSGGDWFVCNRSPLWCKYHAYRVKPEPVRETVTLYGRPDVQWVLEPCAYDTHHITFDTIDGEPDCSTIKMERITKEESK